MRCDPLAEPSEVIGTAVASEGMTRCALRSQLLVEAPFRFVLFDPVAAVLAAESSANMDHTLLDERLARFGAQWGPYGDYIPGKAPFDESTCERNKVAYLESLGSRLWHPNRVSDPVDSHDG
jgi:hypothetical protein